MMKVAYWCNLDFREKYFGYKEGHGLVWVGEVEARDLEDAFRQFNRIDSAVSVLDEAEAPSMSVGDVAEVEETDWCGGWYACGTMGWDEIEKPSAELLSKGQKAGDVIQLSLLKDKEEWG